MNMNKRVFKTNIKEFKSLENPNLSFRQRISLEKRLKEWRNSPSTKRCWASKKRQSIAKALREFKDLYDAKEFCTSFGENDDSFEILYR